MLTEKIDVPEELLFYLTAFFDLCSHRQLGFGGEGPIPTLAVFEYAKYFYSNFEDAEDLLFYIRRLDSVYLKHAHKKNSKKAKKR